MGRVGAGRVDSVRALVRAPRRGPGVEGAERAETRGGRRKRRTRLLRAEAAEGVVKAVLLRRRVWRRRCREMAETRLVQTLQARQSWLETGTRSWWWLRPRSRAAGPRRHLRQDLRSRRRRGRDLSMRSSSISGSWRRAVPSSLRARPLRRPSSGRRLRAEATAGDSRPNVRCSRFAGAYAMLSAVLLRVLTVRYGLH